MRKSKLFYGLALVLLAGVVLFIGSMVSNSIGFHWGSRHIGFASSDTFNQVDSISINDITELSSQGVSDIEIIPSDEYKVRLYYDKNYYTNLSKIDGHQLLVDFDSKKHSFLGWDSPPDIHVKIYTNRLTSIRQEGIGDISSKGILSAEKFSVNNDGIGSMQLQLQVTTLDVNNAGVGSIELRGHADNMVFDNDGTGSIDAIQLLGKIAKVSNSGVGSVDVNASESLDMNNSGVGNITYTGNAIVTNKISDGVGSIQKK